jgi:hypothetical protein
VSLLVGFLSCFVGAALVNAARDADAFAVALSGAVLIYVGGYVLGRWSRS